MTEYKKFQYRIQIKEHHLDTFGHVNNATYLELLEEARWEFLLENGLDLRTIHVSGIGPVVLECHIQFLKELRLREWITIQSQLISFEKKIGIMEQDILNEDGATCSKAKLTFGVFDLKLRKLIHPSEQWLKAIGVSG